MVKLGMYYRLLETSFGTVGIIFKGDKAVRITLPSTKTNAQKEIRSISPEAEEHSTGMQSLAEMIQGFFYGENVVISMDFVDISLVTPFQLRVLMTERSIPRGKTASYSWLARNAGTKAIRAAGSVLARNPWPIVVPCHRAVHKDRSIGQYQGGPSMKRKLLEMEGVEFENESHVSVSSFIQ